MGQAGTMTVRPVARTGGTLRVPGDKSISHRVAMLAAMACGTSEVDGFLCSEDCLNTLAAMETLGAGIRREGGRVFIRGTGGKLHSPGKVLDMGNSGTGIRLLTGLLAGQPVQAELTGDVSLRSRPMTRIQQPLVEMGACIELCGERGCAPIRVSGKPLQPICYRLPMASAQVKSAVLLAALAVNGETTVIEPLKTRDHTERLLQAMGIPVEVDGLTLRLHSAGIDALALKAGHWVIPGDFSSAAFWVTAAAMADGTETVIEGVGLNPRRTALLDVLRRMGADIRCVPDAGSQAWEMTGSVIVRGCGLKGCEVGGDEIPNLIDELPLVAVAGAVAAGVTTVRDAQELRVKESDRIAAICRNLIRMGVDAVETADGFVVRGGPVAGNAVLKSYGDHRIVMAMAVLTLRAQMAVEIRDTGCVATSYPMFWDDLNRMTGRNPV